MLLILKIQKEGGNKPSAGNKQNVSSASAIKIPKKINAKEFVLY